MISESLAESQAKTYEEILLAAINDENLTLTNITSYNATTGINWMFFKINTVCTISSGV